MENAEDKSRRSFLKGSLTFAGATVLLPSCSRSGPDTVDAKRAESERKKDEDDEDVTAVEDLMREHGLIRRALIVYSSAAMSLRKDARKVSPEALQKTAKLFRSFGEDYHEKQLEEANIFPMIRQKGGSGPAAAYPDILTDQHDRGREITDYILSATNTQKISANAEIFADTLMAFVWMYESHAAREDTIVFPAWKELLSKDDYKEAGEKFEDIEKQQFGGDGFETALKEITEIEADVGLGDLAKFTPPSPAK